MTEYYTCAVQTGGAGMSGMISLLLLERGTPGINVRRMKTQFDCAMAPRSSCSKTSKSPNNMNGKQGEGFGMLVRNFNHERLVIAAGMCCQARLYFEEAIAEWSRCHGKRFASPLFSTS